MWINNHLYFCSDFPAEEFFQHTVSKVFIIKRYTQNDSDVISVPYTCQLIFAAIL